MTTVAELEKQLWKLAEQLRCHVDNHIPTRSQEVRDKRCQLRALQQLCDDLTLQVGAVEPEENQRCRYCDKDHWKWICFTCHEETSVEMVKALQLQLDVAVLNAGNPVLEKLVVMDGDECIGVVVPDTLKVIDDMGIIVPESYREKLDERNQQHLSSL